MSREIAEQGQTREPDRLASGIRRRYVVWGWTVGREELAAKVGGSVVEDMPSARTGFAMTQQALEKAVERLFKSAEDMHFEDGMESPFSRGLLRLVRAYREQIKELLAYWLLLGKCSAEVAAEALRWLGGMDDGPSYRFRRWLIERSLGSPSICVRDGAALGLAAMDDPHAIPHIRRAVEHEQCKELKELLCQVVAQLEE